MPAVVGKLDAPQLTALIVGLVILWVVWEFAPRMWGALLLVAVVLVLAAKALKALPSN